MSTRVAATMATGLTAALRLARGRADGLALLDSDPESRHAATARSFWAAALCVPPLLLLELLSWWPGGPPPRPGHEIAASLLSLAASWSGFAVVSYEVCGLLGRRALWWRFIAAWNWCSVVQFLLLTAAALPILLGFPALLAQVAWLVALGWGLWLEWFATRLALNAGPMLAGGFVLLDIMLTLGLDQIQAALPG